MACSGALFQDGSLTRALNIAVVAAALICASSGRAAEVRDDTGRLVSLPHPARRIVTLAPHATELVLAAGARARLVAIANGRDAPQSLAALPQLGGPGGTDREALLALQPDLVIAWQSGNRASDLDWIERTGIAVFRSEPRSLADVADAILAIGELSDTSQAASQAAAAFHQAVATPCAGLPLQAAYVTVWDRPEMTVGGLHWINSVLRSAGYRNVFDGLPRGVFRPSPEAVLANHRLPQISLMRRFDASTGDRLADLLSRPGPRLGGAVQLLCARRLAESRAAVREPG